VNHQRIKPAESPIDELLNRVQEILNIRTRTATIKKIGSTPATVSRIRKGELTPSADLVLRVHDLTGLSVAEIRKLGDIAITI